MSTATHDRIVDDDAGQANMLAHNLRRVVALVESGLFDQYVVYENQRSWVVAGGVAGSVVLTPKTVTTTWEGADTDVASWSGSPARALSRALDALPAAQWTVFGWVGFDFSAYVHASPLAHTASTQDTTLARLFVPRTQVTLGDAHGDGVVITGATDAERQAVLDVLDAAGPSAAPCAHELEVGDDSDGFRERAALAIEEVRRGDYAKVVLSRSVPIPFELDLPRTYLAGRLANTPARSFLLELGDVASAGFSPELVVSVDADRMVTAEPLAGTRAFGMGREKDWAARLDLEQDPKEIAEHAVSVRTAVREVESVAQERTTTVSDFMSVRERGSVQHLASTVRGLLRDELTPWDAFAAVFPAVTASGIPKREAIDAITRLEGDARGLYSGAVVRASSDGSLEAALVLRAVYSQGGTSWLRAGAGIVEQSTPDREFDETCEKLASVAPYLIRRVRPEE